MNLAAVLAAFQAFTTFLTSPQGQQFASTSEGLVGKLFSHFGVHLDPAPQVAQPLTRIASGFVSDPQTQTHTVNTVQAQTAPAAELVQPTAKS